MAYSSLSKLLIKLIGERLDWEALPYEFRHTRNGWAGYKGEHRITKFCFSEEGAREAAIARDAADVKIE